MGNSVKYRVYSARVKNLEELKTDIKDAYDLVMQETVPTPVEKLESTELSLAIPY